MTLEPINIVCPHCGNVGYMRHLVGKGVGRLDIKCINCNSYFTFDELYKQAISDVIKLKRTNADRIRAKTDEGLAEWLVVVERRVVSNLQKVKAATDDTLIKDWLDWLKQEVDDG